MRRAEGHGETRRGTGGAWMRSEFINLNRVITTTFFLIEIVTRFMSQYPHTKMMNYEMWTSRSCKWMFPKIKINLNITTTLQSELLFQRPTYQLLINVDRKCHKHQPLSSTLLQILNAHKTAESVFTKKNASIRWMNVFRNLLPFPSTLPERNTLPRQSTGVTENSSSFNSPPESTRAQGGWRNERWKWNPDLTNSQGYLFFLFEVQLRLVAILQSHPPVRLSKCSFVSKVGALISNTLPN